MYSAWTQSVGLVLWVTHILYQAESDLVNSLVKRTTGDICRAFPCRTAVIGNTLYFTGGTYAFRDLAGENGTLPQNLYSIVLNSSVPTEDLISADLITSVDIPDAPPWKGETGFFHDDETLYLFAGAVQTPSNQLWTYGTKNNQWSQVSVNGVNFQFDGRGDAVMMTVPSTKTSFYTGGYDTNVTGIVVFNASNPNSLQWSNQTDAQSSGGVDMPRLIKGTMSYVPVGQAGALVVMGGFDTTSYNTKLPGWGWDPRDMSNISVYDIASSNWYRINATGEVPGSRSGFCVGMSQANDSSSYQITMFGGYDLLRNHSLHDLYVLSIPSFRWISVDAANDLDSSSGYLRKFHRCYMQGLSQMISFGGDIWNTKGVDVNQNGCDNSMPVLKSLNTSSYQWQSSIADPAEYTVPDVVTSVIGGSGLGGATLKQPENGWPDPDLQPIFSQSLPYDPADANFVPGSITTGSRTISNSKSDSSSSPNSKATSSNARAIAGGVVGGLAAAAMIGATIVYLVRIHKRSGSAPPPRKEDPYMTAAGGNVRNDSGVGHDVTKVSINNDNVPHELWSPGASWSGTGASSSRDPSRKTPSKMSSSVITTSDPSTQGPASMMGGGSSSQGGSSSTGYGFSNQEADSTQDTSLAHGPSEDILDIPEDTKKYRVFGVLPPGKRTKLFELR